MSASKRNAARKRRGSVLVPWREAVQILGDQARLEEYLTRPEVIQNLKDKDRASIRSRYKDDGVPIQEIGEPILERLGSGFRFPQDDEELAEVIAEVRKLYEMRQHRREHDWRVLLALLNLSVSYSGSGVSVGRP